MSDISKIPFLDLVTMHQELEEDLTSVFRSALRTGGFVGGPVVEQFEHEFAAFCGAKHCVGVASGTDALRFALMASGVRKNEVVITVPNTFIATSEAITQAGGYPEFVDVDERTCNMDPVKLEEYCALNCYTDRVSGRLIDRRLGRLVSAVIPVHLYGQMANMDAILDVAERYNLMVIEDACQAHGASYYSTRQGVWKKAGSMGKAAAFSFYPGKNLGACGEGGAITTDDAMLAQTARMLRDHGQAKKYYHETEGYNGRLDAIQAGLLKVKLGHLETWNQQRRASAQRYQELFAADQERIGLPYEPAWAKAVYHLYVVRTRNRDEVQAHLGEAGIGTGIHYPIPLHLQNAYRLLGHERGDYPVAEQAAAEILSLPMFPGLGAEAQHRVVECVREVAAYRVAAAAV